MHNKALRQIQQSTSFYCDCNQSINDLNLTLQFASNTATETYYGYFYLDEEEVLEVAIVLIDYNNKSFQCELPWDSFKTFNNIVTLDIEKQALISSQSVWIIAGLIAMYVMLNLLIEGLIFFLFDFKNKKS